MEARFKLDKITPFSQEECALNIEKLENDVIGYLKYMTRDSSLALDLAQESMIRAIPLINSEGSVDKIKPFILRVARNLAIDHFRSVSSKHKAILEMSNEPDHETQEASPETLVIEKQQKEKIFEIFSSLGTADRDILSLYYYNDLNLKEIAQLLSIPLNTAITKLVRARRKLKNKLTKGLET